MLDELLQKALSQRRESKKVDFKESFDPTLPSDWCEIIKDFVAMANSGGGVIVIGVANNGECSKLDLSTVSSLDPATITDKVSRYVGKQFTEFELSEHSKNGSTVVCIRIFEVELPLVFEKPGTYSVGGGKQKTAFSQGAVYFRHGAKSEPGNTDDLRRVLQLRLDETRRDWERGVRKVIRAPKGSHVQVLSGEVVLSNSPDATPVRITNDPAAPPIRDLDKDGTHPHRQKEVLRHLNTRLPKGIKVTAHELLSVRRVYHVDNESDFYHKPKFGSPQYSPAFVEWLLKQFEEAPNFFQKAKDAYRAQSKRR